MSSNMVQVNWESQKKVLFSNLSLLRKKEIHTDVTLACEGENYAAHRLVLTMGSGYFAKNLENVKGASSSLVLICGIRSCILKALLNFVYDGKTTIKSEDINDLSKAGAMLEVPGLMDLGKELILRGSIKLPDSAHNFKVSPQQLLANDKTSPSSTQSIVDNVEEDSKLESKSDGNEVVVPLEEENETEKTAIKTLSVDSLFDSDSCDSENMITFEGWEKEKSQETKIKSRVKHGSTRGKRRNKKCHICSKSFYKMSSLQDHLQYHEAKKATFNCSFCIKSFVTDDLRKTHMKIHLNEKENVKDLSKISKKMEGVEEKENDSMGSKNVPPRNNEGKDSRNSSMMDSVQAIKRRKKSNDSYKDYTIDDVLKSVSKSFETLTNNSQFSIHDDSIYDEGIIDDEDRAEAESSNSILKLKETLNLGQSVSTVNTRACRFCNVEFLSSKSFRKHRITDCKILECPFCLASFESRKDYDSHITVHEGIDRPYTCPECTYRTDSKRNFEDHMSLHTGIFRFWCLLCDFQAKRIYELKSHIKEDHPEVNLNALDELLSK